MLQVLDNCCATFNRSENNKIQTATIISNLFAVIPFVSAAFWTNLRYAKCVRLCYWRMFPVTNAEWTIHSIGNGRIPNTSAEVRVCFSRTVCVHAGELCSLYNRALAHSLRCKVDFILDFMPNWMHVTRSVRETYVSVHTHSLRIDTIVNRFSMPGTERKETKLNWAGCINFSLSLIYL